MLVLFETSVGYAIFKVLNEKKLQEVDSLWKEFETPEKANKIVKLKHFEKFQDTAEALAAFTALMEGKINKQLKKVLKKIVKEAHEPLAVADAKLGGVIKEKLNLSCIHSPVVNELMRGIRSQMDGLIPGVEPREMAAMCLGLAHREWYGWHFPELGKIISDNLTYCKCLQKVGDRKNYASATLSELLSEEVEAEVKAAAEISMGTEVSEEDICNILHLCTQVIEISEYRTQLYEYLQNRMMAIAPNVTVMVGELVGARLIAHAGSLLNLAKHAASTVQILGAEKALFRALKSRRDTPKYGLIYHASLISRMLAAKTVLAIRYDAFGEDSSSAMGVENRAKLEARLRILEDRGIRKISGTGKALAKAEKYEHKSEVKTYDPSAEVVEEEVEVEAVEEEEQVVEEEPSVKKKKKKDKKKHIKEEPLSEEEPCTSTAIPSPEKKKKKKKKKEAED
ncbi:hypothetical protein A6R68_12718 [Neotoma lepida]|uniref:Nop domain-containing protein n=1 Tax=Neotoma lepida TaxID=56216 RepID=A0A1A6H335_NEOLE|nr:hypothetical protein A6R68_12718 [Neotoma lepida]